MMKTNILFSFLLLSLFLITACNKDEDPQPSTPDNTINFSDLREGQSTTYIRYTTKCDSLDQLFEYSGDTLILEVIKRNDSLFFVESVTPESPLYLSGAFVNPVEYPVFAYSDRINIPNRFASALFFFYENDDLFVNPQHDVNLIQSDCRLLQDNEPFIGNDIGYVDHFEVGDVKIEEKTAVSCEPLNDLDAYLIYDEKELIVSHVILFEGLIGPTTERVSGWKVLK